MVKRSRIRPLLLLGMAVALSAHLWMLNEPIPAMDATLAAGGATSASVGAGVTAPDRSGGGHDPGMRFMALTCLAVLMGVIAAPWLGTGLPLRASSRAGTRPPPFARASRLLGWPPPTPPSRVDAGILLLV